MLGEREKERATEGKREGKTKVGETEKKRITDSVDCGIERATDREGAGKIDTMEERERDKSGSDRKTVWEREQD